MDNEVIAIVEDSRLGRLGSLKCAKEIWELALIPVLLNSAEIWSAKDPKLFKALDDFQCKFWRGLLAVPKSCPIPALRYESNSKLMKYRVYRRILNFAKHIFCHNEESNLARQVMNEQLLHDWPGLSQHAICICNELNVSGLFDTQVSKTQFKSIVKKACLKFNEEELNKQISSYKKMSALQN